MLVIGGGAAGLMAAVAALQNGGKVVLLERNEKAGKKIYISGKGRCNLTNVAEKEEFFKNVPTNPKFLYSAVNLFDSEKVRAFFIENRVPLKVERGGRVFPESDKASDVTAALVKKITSLGGKIVYDERVESVEKEGDEFIVKTKNNEYRDFSVVVATGGVSYPSTGSTGDGYAIAERFGHSIVEPKPALSALLADTPSSLSGLSLKNVELKISGKGKTLFKDFGEMLFTLNGVSGPIVLTASSVVNKYEGNMTLSVDLKAALDYETLEKRVLRDFKENINKSISNTLPSLLPKSLIKVVLEKSDIDPEKKVNSITKEERRRLIETLKGLTFNIRGFAPIEQAIVTSGGVNVKEINPKTMESKLVKGLYFAGEVIDYDCFTGGFNIQSAFSTGYAAGTYASQNDIR